MYGIIFLLLAMLCQHPTHSNNGKQKVTTQTETIDDPGDTGHVPPPPPPPPPTNP